MKINEIIHMIKLAVNCCGYLNYLLFSLLSYDRNLHVRTCFLFVFIAVPDDVPIGLHPPSGRRQGVLVEALAPLYSMDSIVYICIY